MNDNEEDNPFKDLTPKQGDEPVNKPADGFSEIEAIRQVEKMRSHFVFFFGKQNSGKSGVLSSLLYYLRNDSNYGRSNVVSKFAGDKGPALEDEIQKTMKQGKFIERTTSGTVTCLTVKYTPHKPQNSEKKYPVKEVTFLEMSGEDLTEVSIQKGSKLPTNIDLFFKIEDLPMMFILVIPWDWEKDQKASSHKIGDDTLTANFFDYLEKKSPKTRAKAKVILLISKWDSNPDKDEPVEKFIERNLPQTYAQIRNQKNITEVYSVGNIVDTNEGYYIQKHNLYYPQQLWREIYRYFSGFDLEEEPAPEPVEVAPTKKKTRWLFTWTW